MNTTFIRDILSSFSVEENKIDQIMFKITKKIKSLKITKVTKRKKDKDSPKNPLNSYMFYCNSNRSKVKEENPDLDAKSVTKEIALRWNSMSDEEKTPFVVLAAKDKERYKKEMEKYKQENDATIPADDKKTHPTDSNPNSAESITPKVSESNNSAPNTDPVERKSTESKKAETKKPVEKLTESKKAETKKPVESKLTESKKAETKKSVERKSTDSKKAETKKPALKSYPVERKPPSPPPSDVEEELSEEELSDELVDE